MPITLTSRAPTLHPTGALDFKSLRPDFWGEAADLYDAQIDAPDVLPRGSCKVIGFKDNHWVSQICFRE